MPSLRVYLMHLALRHYFRPRLLRLTIEEQRQNSAARARLFRLPPGIQVEPVSSGPVSGEWVSQAGAASDYILYYIHGGGFYTGSSKSCRHFSLRLAQAAG